MFVFFFIFVVLPRIRGKDICPGWMEFFVCFFVYIFSVSERTDSCNWEELNVEL